MFIVSFIEEVSCRPLINIPLGGLDIRILIIIPTNGKGFLNHGPNVSSIAEQALHAYCLRF